MPPFYITTPIYYVNDVPHLGHAYTTIVADALSRFHRMRGDDTYFLTGTDEHGQKIEEAADKRGVTPIELADRVVERFRETWTNLGIANDDFIRTTEDRHKAVVSEVWRRIEQRGDITLGAYKGWYCVPCEAFYPETQLVDGTQCPIHKSAASWVEEPSYFFAMSKYQDRLLQHIADHPNFIRPENYKNEIISFVKSGLRDLSVSRTTFKWGIPVPDHPEHVIYVWIDALTNYMSALGAPGTPLYQRYWPATCHLIGKDILRFHAVYWPCMLMSAGLPLPETIMTHGWWTVRGEKISKSMPATRVDPNQLAADLGADALRYFLLREVPLGLDGDFSYEALIGRYNADLANDLGNLTNRCLTMAGKFAGGAVPAADPAVADLEAHAVLATTARECVAEAARCFEDYAPSRALEVIWRLVREANRYVDAVQPWKLAKDPTREAELAHCVRGFLEAIFWSARMVSPVMPDKARAILGQLGVTGEAAEHAVTSWPDPEAWGRDLPTGQVVGKGEPVFPRIDAERQEALLKRWIPEDALASAAPTTPAPAPTTPTRPLAPPVTFQDFQRLDFRVALIKAAEPVPKTKKLLKLRVDVGEPSERQVIAGIAAAYPPESLVGRKVILLANLEPATIRGVESQGMVLAIGDEEILGLSAIDKDVPPGTIVR
ncbi:MAG TPA: methionine--tRNA ligase [Kofleriaceae bacterium]|nr:methionine--tRNA ligase [Kofleriaceae bacterium]